MLQISRYQISTTPESGLIYVTTIKSLAALADPDELRRYLDGTLTDAIRDALSHGWMTADQEQRMAAGVFDGLPAGYRHCSGMACPVTPDCRHAVIAMNGLAFWMKSISAASDKPVADGLAPSQIILVKAHAVVVNDGTMFNSFQWGTQRAGMPSSFGGVLVSVPVPSGEGAPHPVRRFVIAVSGADKRVDHFIAQRLEAALVAYLMMKGFIELAEHVGQTFIIGLSPAAVAQFAGD